MRKTISCLIVAALTCPFLSGCTRYHLLDDNFFQASAPGRKLPMKVVLVEDEQAKDRIVTWGFDWCAEKISINEPLGKALQAEFATVFQEVVVAKGSAPSQEHDFFITLDLASDKTVKLLVNKQGADKTILELEQPGIGYYNVPRRPSEVFIATLLFPVQLIICAVRPGQLKRSVGKKISNAVKGFSAGIRANAKVLEHALMVDRAGPLEKSGDSALRAGRPREALATYVRAIKLTFSHSAMTQRLLEKAIKASLSVRPRPPVPEEAERFAIRGQARFKKAKAKADYALAVEELKKAVRAAPWWPEAYFNLALVQEKAGQPVAALRNLKLYLLAKPGARDAKAVKRKIIELELELETSQ